MAESRTAQESLGERFTNIKTRINRALERSHRGGRDITLIAISKTHPAALVQELLALGARDFGENRVQEAETKIPAAAVGKPIFPQSGGKGKPFSGLKTGVLRLAPASISSHDR